MLYKNSVVMCGLYLNIYSITLFNFDNLLLSAFKIVTLGFLCFSFRFPSPSEHVTSNASDSESSYRKCSMSCSFVEGISAFEWLFLGDKL